MTRALTSILACLVLALAACGGDDGDEAGATTTTGDQALKVGLITDLGQLNDRGFNQLAYEGLKRAQSELGVDGRVLESRSASEYVPNMTTLARQGYDLIIGVGFAQGDAMATAPGVKTLNGYSQDWDDQAKCKELALNQIQAGATVVFQVAGGCGLGALDAARERNVWGIGVDADQSFLGDHVLTSALKKVDQGVFLAIQSVIDGTWKGGSNLVFGLNEEGVGLGTISDEVPQGDQEAVDQVAKRIADGEIDVPRELG